MADKNAWPPPHMVEILSKVTEWDAWYKGDRASLEAMGTTYAADYQTGIVGVITKVWRRFWGSKPFEGNTDPKIKIHVPLAADIARATPDLLFAEPPSITAKDDDTDEAIDDASDTADGVVQDAERVPKGPSPIAVATAARLEEYERDGLIGTLMGASEVCAAKGGIFLRATWVPSSKRMYMERMGIENAIPSFKHGELHRVTFWREVQPYPNEKRGTLRHLEIHELQRELHGSEVKEIGIIRHELWEGTSSDLGSITTLDESPDLEGILDMLEIENNADGVISTLTEGLDVVYIPNMTPSPYWEHHSIGRYLGVPDIAGSEDLLDRLDHATSSMFREVDLSRARMVIPQSWLENLKAGSGQIFDNDREIFTQVNAPPNSAPGGAGVAEFFQPELRVDKYMLLTQQITEDIIRHARFSASTFGEDESGAVTATEVNSKNVKTRSTRQRKIGEWQPRLERLLKKMLAMELAFKWITGIDPELVSVTFPAPTASMTELALYVSTLRGVQLMSIRTGLETAHPDWDEKRILAEIAEIEGEIEAAKPEPMEDPNQFGIIAAGTPPLPGEPVDEQDALPPVAAEVGPSPFVKE